MVLGLRVDRLQISGKGNCCRPQIGDTKINPFSETLRMKFKVVFNYLTSIILFLILGGCISGPIEIASAPLAQNEKVIGQAHGSAGGVLLFGFIPIGQNTRFEDAYNQALQSQQGTTRLLNPTIKEQWFWAVILEGFAFQVDGTAVGPK